MSALGAVLVGDRRCGIHRTDLEVADVRAEADALGWAFAYVGGPTVDSRQSVLVAIGEALAFPSYFTGRSLDGLHDCLRDVTEPTVLVWDGWGALASADPSGLRGVLRVLSDRTGEVPGFEVLLRGEGPDDAAEPLEE